MLVIRFFRVGKTNQPSFKIVVADKRNPTRSGRFTEEVGFWNPTTKEKVLKQDRIKYWISVGAKPSPTVFNLLVSEKIVEGKKIAKQKKSKKKVEAKPAEAAPVVVKPAEEKPKEEVKAEVAPEEVKPVEEAKSEEVKTEEPK